MKILITGANGMLAQDIKESFKNEQLFLTDVADLDITNLEAVKEYVGRINPDYIINCAAYTAVDKAEDDKELAYKINAIGPKNLAIAANENKAKLVHVSTDYVYGGDRDVAEEYKEDDEKNPETVYGYTKLQGENLIKENTSEYYIFRTAWLYGLGGKNFVKTMVGVSETRDEVTVVNDQHGSPTYTVDLASIIHQAIDKKIPYGIYNSTNLGNTTWYDFTKKIYELNNIKTKVTPVTSEQFVRPAKRPKNSQMSKQKLLDLGIKIPTWEDGLSRYVEAEKSLKKNEIRNDDEER